MMKRRHFLQFAGSTIATLGLSHLDIIQQGNRYAQVLAQNTPRKLALLVGINKYPINDRNLGNLQGCVTDVDLQEQLLIHRFGFNPSDIIKLTTDLPPNKQPTRNNILQAFEEHLIKQAKPNDVVVFHFSGHGSRLHDSIQNCANQEFNDEFNSTLVVADQSQKNLAPDIMGRTLFLLRSALKTDNVTMVLDSCYSGGGTRGNYRVRSLPGDGLEPLPEEIAYQKRWMKELGLTEAELAQQRCAGVGKGVVIASAQRDEEAADVTFDGFAAGAFSYLMTQYLWQQADTFGKAITDISNTMKSVYHQVPLADGNNNQRVYFIGGKSTPPADAVITSTAGDLWLGGVDTESLAAFQRGATFTIVNERGQTSAKLELVSRNGLKGKAKLVERGANAALKPGTLLQETSRVVPADLKLSIGLDLSLAGDTNTAKQALSRINRIEAVPTQQGNVIYPGGVQYILSRMTADYQQKLQKRSRDNLPGVGSIGLFTEGLELVPQSFGEVGETVTDGVSRLEAKLKSLLAARIIKMTLNANSSQLDVEVSMNLVEQPNQTLAKIATLQGRNNRRQSEPIYPHKLPTDKLFQFRVTNHTSNNLHLTMLLIDSTGGLVVIFPYEWNVTKETTRLAANQTLVIGEPEQLKLQAIQNGTAEALVIVSRSPLKKAVQALRSLAQEQNQQSGAVEINREPVEVISDLLDDLSREGGIGVEAREVRAAEIATLSITFEVGG